METLQSFVVDVVALWKGQHHREQLYKRAMTFEELGPLRRTLSHGYISSILCKKELQGIYDLTKCNLNDGEIQDREHEAFGSAVFPKPDRFEIIYEIKEQDRQLTRLYRNFLLRRHLADEVNNLIGEHIKNLREICEYLDKQFKKLLQAEEEFV